MMFAENTQAVLHTGALRSSIRVADISLELLGCDEEDVKLSPGLEMFQASDGPPDIAIDVDWVRMLRPHLGAPTFDSGACWSVWTNDRDFTFDFSSSAISAHPYKRLQVNADFTSVRLLLSREALKSHLPIFPLEYPADELLITNFMPAHGLGVEVHGCGLIDAEAGGFLFLGHSGAGKSTTTRLWQSARNPEILSDDRIILRFHDDELWMHGTPWHGEGRFASPGSSRIDKILILQHSDRNRITRMHPSRAAGELFARSFPPFHSPSGLQGTIDFLDRIVSRVACYEFGFVPDRHAVDVVMEMDHVNGGH